EGVNGYVCPSVVVGKGVAYVCGGGPFNMSQTAVRGGGGGGVTKTHVLWHKQGGANVPTPVYYKGNLFGVGEQPAGFCLNAESGESDYQQRLQASLEPELQPVVFQPPPGGRGRRGMGRGGFPGGGFPGGGRGFGGGGLSFYASAAAADDKIFLPSRENGVFVVAADSKFELLACNKFEGDKSRFDGTPAISAGQIFLRSNEYLYCVAKTK